MPRMENVKERLRKPFWDSLIRGTPGAFTPRTAASLASSPIKLFRSANTGDVAVTNMQSAGQFPSNDLYNVYALRVNLFFRGCTSLGGLTDFIMYHRAISQLFWELVIASKQAFQSPTSFLPAGGGLFGDVGSSTDVYFVNGNPTQSAALELAKPLSIEKQQTFEVNCTISACGTANFATDMAALTAGEVYIWFGLDGIYMRDVL